MEWTLGQYIEQLLDARHWTKTDLAKAAKLSDAYVGYIVRGYASGKPNPPSISIDALIALSKALQVSELNLISAYKGKNPIATEDNSAQEVLRLTSEFVKQLPRKILAQAMELEAPEPESPQKSTIVEHLLNTMDHRLFAEALLAHDGPEKVQEYLAEARRRNKEREEKESRNT